MAKAQKVRIDGLGDPKLEQKVAQVRMAQTQPSMVLAPPRAVMEPPTVVPRLQRMRTTSDRGQQIADAVMAQARSGTMGGLPLKLFDKARVDRKNYWENFYAISDPLEQAFTYDWNLGLFGIAPVVDSRVVDGVVRNTVRWPRKAPDAYIHTHPEFVFPEPGPEDFQYKAPMFVIHPNRISEGGVAKGRRSASMISGHRKIRQLGCAWTCSILTALTLNGCVVVPDNPVFYTIPTAEELNSDWRDYWPYYRDGRWPDIPPDAKYAGIENLSCRRDFLCRYDVVARTPAGREIRVHEEARYGRSEGGVLVNIVELRDPLRPDR
jgi:hypothetical protein